MKGFNDIFATQKRAPKQTIRADIKREKEILSISEASVILGVDRRKFRSEFLETGKIPILTYSSLNRPKMLKQDILNFRNKSRGVIV